MLTHHPQDAQPAAGVTFLSCDIAEAVRIGLEAADGKNLEVFSPSIGRQLLELGVVDEVNLHVAPVLLGDGIRLLGRPGSAPVRLALLNGDAPLGPGERALPPRHVHLTGQSGELIRAVRAEYAPLPGSPINE
ncbi:dihydrofolate reductase family protein [Streptomyces sp. NWU339]|uniref:dihydrofolate reductase family protein n=1 Tax=Streptomyces sp. NWU339 TaxID=2185284 RepID=UPI00215A4EF7|nr:dihydrofolate reductase family protein [Streptomyces sp. NWU339]